MRRRRKKIGDRRRKITNYELQEKETEDRSQNLEDEKLPITNYELRGEEEATPSSGVVDGSGRSHVQEDKTSPSTPSLPAGRQVHGKERGDTSGDVGAGSKPAHRHIR